MGALSSFGMALVELEFFFSFFLKPCPPGIGLVGMVGVVPVWARTLVLAVFKHSRARFRECMHGNPGVALVWAWTLVLIVFKHSRAIPANACTEIASHSCP